MQVIPKQIISPQSITDSLANYYTSPAKKSTLITKLTLTNNGGGAAEAVDIHIVPNGDTADATNQVISARTINVDEAVPVYQLEGLLLNEGDSLQVKSDTASSAVVIVASGAEIF